MIPLKGKNFIWLNGTKRAKIKTGGLGIKSVKKQNLALLGKLEWKVTVQDDRLWANILRHKYLNNHDISIPFLELDSLYSST